MTTFAIRDVNGIADLQINLREPGVYVCRGPNGCGKTSAINAIRAACGDDATAEPTDGLQRGTVALSDGLVLTVGKQRRLNGEPTVQLARTGALGRLIEPSMSDPAAASKARLRALLELVPLPADEKALHELCDNDAALAAGLTRGHYPDALALAESVRRQAQELARTEETRATKAQGELESVGELLTDLGDVPEHAPTTEDAMAAWTSATRVADRLLVAARAREDLERRQAEIRSTLGERPDPEAAERRAESARAAKDEAEKASAAAGRELQAAHSEWQRVKREADQWDIAAGVLAKPVEGPTLAEAKQAEADAIEAAAAVDDARKLAQATEYRRICGTARTTHTEAHKRATELRRIAARTTYALGRLLQRSGLPGITIDDGKLAVVSEDGSVSDFATRLSFGQRVRIALQVALHSCRRRGNVPVILPLEPEFWAALDPDRKADVCQASTEAGVILVTEEPTEGELRVERAGASA